MIAAAGTPTGVAKRARGGEPPVYSKARAGKVSRAQQETGT